MVAAAILAAGRAIEVRPAVVVATEEGIDRAVEVLRAGGLVALPTETVYGLAADAANPDAVRRVFAAKGRPPDHPLIVHLASAADLHRWAAEVPPAAERLAAACWPGPLTLVLARGPDVLDVVTGGRPTVGLRVPDQPVALAVLRRFGGGLAAPSANRFGRVSPTRAEHVVADLGDRVDLFLDGGPCQVGVESTIVEVVGERACVLRVGVLTADELSAIAGIPVAVDTSGPARAPGMLASHYAPRARVLPTEPGGLTEALAALPEGTRAVVLAEASPPGLPAGVGLLEPVGDATGYARHLYERLRAADDLGADLVIAVLPAPEGPGLAVRDRLRRAAHPG
jgi:L-threonylcarbamoyladenylate synthase